MMVKKCGKTGLSLSLWLFWGCVCAWAGDGASSAFLVMETVGIQRPEESVAARSRAEQAVLRRAVERFVLEKLPETDMQTSIAALSPLWTENPGPYVREFTTLAALQGKDTYRLVARVFLDAERLTRRMKDLGLGFSRLPGLLFMVAEQGLEDRDPRRWWDADVRISRTGGRTMEALVAAMETAGFSVVLPDDRPLEKGRVMETSLLDTREARRVGMLFGAPVVVAGRVLVVPGGNQMGEHLRSFRGEITLIAMDTEKGDVLAEVEESVTVVNDNAATGEREALYQVGTKAAARLAPDLRAAWLRRASGDPGIAEILMDIQGENYLSRFVQFRKILAETEGVVSIERREMTTSGMEIRIRYQGEAEALATDLLRQTYGAFGIRISHVEKNRMQVTLVSSP